MKYLKTFSIFWKEFIVLTVVILLSTIFRFEGVFSLSFPFTYDIGRDLLIAREISALEKIPLIGATTGLPGLFYGPWWYYFLGLIYIPFRGDPALITGFISFTGVVTVLLGYFLGKKIDGIFLGLVFASLLGFSSVVISLTSQIWNPTLIPILWIVVLFNLYYIYNNDQRLILYFSLGVLLMLIVDMEIVVGMLFGAGIFISLLLTKLLPFKKFLLLFSGAILVLSPRIIFDLRHDFLLSNTLFDGILKLFISNGGIERDLQITHKLNVLLLYWNDTLAQNNYFIGVAILLLAILTLVKVRKKESDALSFFIKITLYSIAVTVVGVLFFGHDIWPHYLVALPLLFVFLISLVLTLLYKEPGYKLFAIITTLFIVFLNLNFLERLSNIGKPLWEGDAAVYRNQLKVVDFIFSDANSHKFKYVVYTPPVYDYTYEYLFKWYGENKKYKQPSDENAEFMYLIIEPDYQFPKRVDDWLEIRKNDGKILDIKNSSGGIIIQKRVIQ